MKPLLLLPLVVLLQQCAPTPKPEENEFARFYDDGLPSDLSLTKLPIVKSPALEKRWGKPKISVLPDGSYKITYLSPRSSFEALSIYVRPGFKNTDAPKPPPYGSIGFDEKTNAPIPVKTPQEWSTAKIMGKPVHTYCDYAGDGADPASFDSITFSPEIPGSPAFNLTLSATSNTEIYENTARSYMETVKY